MENGEENKENKTESKDFPSSDGYKEGAIAGGIVGLVLAFALKKSIILGGVVGLIAGGYIGHIIKSPETKKMNIRKPKI